MSTNVNIVRQLMSQIQLIHILMPLFRHPTKKTTHRQTFAWRKSTSVHVLAEVKTNLFFPSILAFVCIQGCLPNKHLRSKQSHDCLWNSKAIFLRTLRSRVRMKRIKWTSEGNLLGVVLRVCGDRCRSWGTAFKSFYFSSTLVIKKERI